MRLDVEAIFLESLLAVRASNETVDPRWYRLPRSLRLRSSRCIGLNELIWDPKRTAQDEALICERWTAVSRSTRRGVVQREQVPALAEIEAQRRIQLPLALRRLRRRARDPVPARSGPETIPVRSFVRSPATTRAAGSRRRTRWRRSSPGSRREASRRDGAANEGGAQAQFLEQMIKLSENPEQDNTARMMQLMAGQGSLAQWSAPFRNIEGIGKSAT